MADKSKIILGRAETLHFLEFDIVDIPAKVDTGAYRSAVHADKIRISDDNKTLSFRLLGGHPMFGKLAVTIETNKFSRVSITSSFGHQEERFEVRLKVKLGSEILLTTFSLADRSSKVFPILLGRKLLNDRFIVDTSKSSVDRNELKKQYDIAFPQADNDEE